MSSDTITTPELPDAFFWRLMKKLYQFPLTFDGRVHTEDLPAWNELMCAVFPSPGKEIVDHQESTPFMVALWVQKERLAMALLRSGANPYHANSNGDNVFQSLLREVGHNRGMRSDPRWLANFLTETHLLRQDWEEEKSGTWWPEMATPVWATALLSRRSEELATTTQNSNPLAQLLHFAFDGVSIENLDRATQACEMSDKPPSPKILHSSPWWSAYRLHRCIKEQLPDNPQATQKSRRLI